MRNYTSQGVYIPESIVPLAFSFDGIINDGAPECGLVTFNAGHSAGIFRGLYGEVIKPRKFNDDPYYRNNKRFNAFLALRPLVSKAWEYFVVAEIIGNNKKVAEKLADNPMDSEAFKYLALEFNRICSEIPVQEKDKLDELFYKERKRMQEVDEEAWYETQKPFPYALEELRLLSYANKRAGNRIKRGFVNYVASSKNLNAILRLCNAYVRAGEGCIISEDRIIAKETIKSRDTVERMGHIAKKEEVDISKTVRIDDRYDPGDIERLRDAGVRGIILIPGYTRQEDITMAMEDERIHIIPERNGMASAIGEYVKELGF